MVKRTWLESVAIRTLKLGQIPKHIAIILDGNRRYAKKTGIPVSQGHSKGHDKLKQTVEDAIEFGIEQLTVYAFSIENFKRPKEEVAYLMQLLKNKINELLEDNELIERNAMCIHVLGKLSLLPLDVQQMLAKAVIATKCYSKFHLNLCIAYTAREEMTTAIQELAEGVQQGLIQIEDITEKVFEQCLYTSNSSLDLLIRTSGEKRLSDFLLWQSSFSVIVFQPANWPEYTFWNFCMAIILYQHHNRGREAALRRNEMLQIVVDERTCKIRQKQFVEYLQQKRDNEIEKMQLLQ